MRIIRADRSIIEGSPLEIAEFERLVGPDPVPRNAEQLQPSAVAASIPPSSTNEDDWDYASADVAFRCLTRLKLSKPMKATLRLIYAADQDWVSATDIQRQIGYDPVQFGGMLGAFGRRFVNTPGYVLNSSFFECEWDDTLSCYKYRLPASVRAAVLRARVVG